MDRHKEQQLLETIDRLVEQCNVITKNNSSSKNGMYKISMLFTLIVAILTSIAITFSGINYLSKKIDRDEATNLIDSSINSDKVRTMAKDICMENCWSKDDALVNNKYINDKISTINSKINGIEIKIDNLSESFNKLERKIDKRIKYR